MTDYIFLILGIACAAAGGEFFVRGTVGLAGWARVSPVIVSATFAAFATSGPELAVSISAALAGDPRLGLGDSLGSNVVNVALIFGLSLLVAGVTCPRESLRRDFPVALAVPLVTAGLILDGHLSRLDGIILLTGFFGWIFTVVREARRQRSEAPARIVGPGVWRAAGAGAVGLLSLAVAGRLIVTGATGLVSRHGWDPFVIGAALVAVGTSVPELATVAVASWRGHSEVSLGMIFGSNIFNGLWVVGIVPLIQPTGIEWSEIGPALGFGLASVLLTFPSGGGRIPRWRGGVLLALYVVYLAVIAR